MNGRTELDRRWLAGLVALTALAYLPALGAGYVWDDVPLIVQNRLFEAPFDLRTALTTDLWAGAAIGDEAASGYFRPLMVLSLWLDRALGGQPWVAHLHSWLWHLAAVLAALDLGRRCLPATPAWVGAAVFALHPVQSEAVVWVAARNDLMAATFALVALGAVSGPRPRAGVALVATLLAGLSKESVLLLPVLGAVLLAPTLTRDNARAAGLRLLPLAMGVAGVVGVRLAAGVGAARGPTSAGLELLGRSLPGLVGWIGGKLVAPWPLSTGYALEYFDRLDPVGLVLGGSALLVGAVGVAWRGGPGARVGLAWLAVALAPVGWALSTTGWMGERYLYLPLLGVGWAIGSQLDLRRGWLRGAGVLVLVAWAGAVGLRTLDWQSDRTLWASAWAATPSPFTAESLGHAVRGADGPDAALPWFVQALDDPRPLRTSCEPVVRAAVAAQKMALAAHVATWAHGRGCDGDGFRGWRAITLASTGQWAELEPWLAASDRDPDGRLDVARAALALRGSDSAELARLEARWTGATPLRDQASALVANAERHAPMVEPLPDPAVGSGD